MTDKGTLHSIAAEAGAVIHQLDSFRSHVARLQAEVAGLDVRLHLLAESGQRALAAEPVAAAPSLAGELPNWLPALWAEIVADVNRQLVNHLARRSAAAGGAALAGAIEAEAQATAVQGLVADVLDAEFRVLDDLKLPEAQPVVARYADARDRVLNLPTGRRLHPTGGSPLWPGRLNPPRPDAAACLRLDGTAQAPHVDLSPLLSCLEAAANGQIAGILADLGDTAAVTQRLERDWRVAMERLLDLKHSLELFVQQQRARPSPAFEVAGRIAVRLTAVLRESGVEEMELAPGDRVNTRLHRVVAREQDSRFDPECVIRVLVPGYRYRGELARLAEVVATP